MLPSVSWRGAHTYAQLHWAFNWHETLLKDVLVGVATAVPSVHQWVLVYAAALLACFPGWGVGREIFTLSGEVYTDPNFSAYHLWLTVGYKNFLGGQKTDLKMRVLFSVLMIHQFL